VYDMNKFSKLWRSRTASLLKRETVYGDAWRTGEYVWLVNCLSRVRTPLYTPVLSLSN